MPRPPRSLPRPSWHWPALGLLLTSLLPLSAAPPSPERPTLDEAGRASLLDWLRQPNRTPDEVRERLGPPQHTAWQILYHRYLEQWLYEPPLALRIEFDCLRGQKPHLQTVRPLTPVRR